MKSLLRSIISAFLLLASMTLVFSCSSSDDISGAGDPETIADLSGKKVGVILGSTADMLLADYPDVEVMRYNAPALIMQSLERGKIDALLLDSAVTINASLPERGIKVAFWGVEPADACMGFRYDEPDLCNQFNEYLAGVKSDGSFDALLGKWLTGTVHGVEMPEFDVPADAEPLDIGIMASNVPFAFVAEDGFAGLEVELLEGFATSIGRKAVFHEYEFAALAAGLQSGRVDIVCALMFNTPERAKIILFSDRYFASSNVCCVRDKSKDTQVSFWSKVKKAFYDNIIYENRFKIILEGLWTTLIISFFSILIGTFLGAFMTWRAFSKRKKLWHGFLKGYGAIMHGVPLLVLLMMMFYVVFASSRVSAIWISIITFAIYFGYASCEIFMSGIESVGKGQSEAARSLGFTRFGALRYVVLPQAIKRILPFYEGEAVTLIKETSLVGFIAVVDLTKATDIIQSRTFDAFFPLVIAAVIYFLIAWLLNKGLKSLTNKKSTVK